MRRAKLRPVGGIWVCYLIHNPRVNMVIGSVRTISVQTALSLTLAWLRY